MCISKLNEKYKVILASGSPRRRELLSSLGINYEVIKSEAREEAGQDKPADLVQRLSREKAQEVYDRLTRQGEHNLLVIGADTVVAIDDAILGKPDDAEKAKEYLRLLSGRGHQVYTGCSIVTENGCTSFFEKSTVRVAKLDSLEIDAYVESGDPLDKAGAYGIQGPFGRHISGIEGDYYNVVGLPLNHLYEVLKSYN